MLTCQVKSSDGYQDQLGGWSTWCTRRGWGCWFSTIWGRQYKEKKLSYIRSGYGEDRLFLEVLNNRVNGQVAMREILTAWKGAGVCWTRWPPDVTSSQSFSMIQRDCWFTVCACRGLAVLIHGWDLNLTFSMETGNEKIAFFVFNTVAPYKGSRRPVLQTVPKLKGPDPLSQQMTEPSAYWFFISSWNWFTVYRHNYFSGSVPFCRLEDAWLSYDCCKTGNLCFKILLSTLFLLFLIASRVK